MEEEVEQEEIENESIFIGYFKQKLGRKYGRVGRILHESLTNSLEVSKFKEFPFSHNKPVFSLSLDSVENRYLLSGGMDCKICLFDCDTIEAPPPGRSTLGQIPCIATAGAKQTHKFSVSCLSWYTHDTGMFFSGGFDKCIRFRVGGKVYSIDFSRICTSHSTIGIGCEKPEIRLCDLRSGNVQTLLRGHSSSVMVVRWSPFEEYQLVSGGSDGRVFLWDVRRPGWLDTLLAGGHKKKLDKFTRRYHFDTRRNKPGFAHCEGAAVVGIEFLREKNACLTLATDHKLKLWNLNSGELCHTNFREVNCYATRESRFGVSVHDGRCFVPHQSAVSVYDVKSGRHLYMMNAHFDNVNSVVFNERTVEVVSAAADGSIVLYNSKGENKKRARRM